MVTARSQAWVKLRLDYGRSSHAYLNQRLQIQLELLMMGGVPLETCWAFNEGWRMDFVAGLHLVGCFYWIVLRCTDPWILNFVFYISDDGQLAETCWSLLYVQTNFGIHVCIWWCHYSIHIRSMPGSWIIQTVNLLRLMSATKISLQ